MSVQAGILHFDGAPADRDFLRNLSAHLSEYGPEGEKTHFDGSVGMLYRPVHTTAESHFEHQPMIFDGGRTLTWDGRLDNRDELIASMSMRQDAEHTDVAIVAGAFERWGTDCFGRFVGDWALSICDPSENTLVLARDYIGIRQLFYYVRRNAIMWCSHLSPLAQCGDTFNICDEYIAGYFAFKPAAQLTPYREIRSVRPGSFALIRNWNITEHSFWSFDPWRRTRHKSDAEYEEHYRHLLRQAVRRRLRADAPVLSALSGGLDSSSIVCIADDVAARGEAATQVDTVSYYDLSEPDEDDSCHLALVEEKRGRKGFHLCLSQPEECLPFDYPVFVATPGFGMRTEVTSGMSDVIRKGGYRVILSGTGGDEMNAQALSISVAIADLLGHLHPVKAGEDLIAWSRVTRRPVPHLLCSALLELLPLSFRARFSWRGKLQPWINRRFASRFRIPARQLEDLPGIWFWRPGPRDAAQTIMTLSNDLTFSSPSEIEPRYPYLDQDLVEFLTSIPFEQLLRPGSRRRLMRRALTGLVPPEILRRKTKVSATRCYSLALQKHWQRVEGVLRAPLISDLQLVNRDELRQDLVDVRNGHCPLHLVRLLKALSLEFWLRDVTSRGIIASPDHSSHYTRKDLLLSKLA